MAKDLPLIMIVDDDEQVLNSLNLFLEDDFKIITCTTGKEALEKIHPDILTVVLDIHLLYGDDGFKTCSEIKKRYLYIPIIFHSSYENLKNPFDIINNYKPFGYISKSSDKNLLKDSIQSAVKYYKHIRDMERMIKNMKISF